MHYLFVSESQPTDSVETIQTGETREDWMDWG